MKRRLNKALRALIATATERQAKRRDEKLAQAKHLEHDTEIDDRESKCLCLVCYYAPTPRLAMQAFWDWTCRLCGKEDRNPNSAVPSFCLECATHHHICMICGAEQTLRPLPPPPITKGSDS